MGKGIVKAFMMTVLVTVLVLAVIKWLGRTFTSLKGLPLVGAAFS